MKHLAQIKTKRKKKQLLTPAERSVARAWRQTPRLAVARVTYFEQLAASSHNEAAAPCLGASEQAATAQFKSCLFRAITAQNAALIITGRMCAAAERALVCYCGTDKVIGHSQISLHEDKNVSLIILQTLQLQDDIINTNIVHPP